MNGGCGSAGAGATDGASEPTTPEFFALGRTVYKAGCRRTASDGTVSESMNFAVCEIARGVGTDDERTPAEEIADLLCLGTAARRARSAPEGSDG